jgi:hypothetical protein
MVESVVLDSTDTEDYDRPLDPPAEGRLECQPQPPPAWDRLELELVAGRIVRDVGRCLGLIEQVLGAEQNKGRKVKPKL